MKKDSKDKQALKAQPSQGRITKDAIPLDAVSADLGSAGTRGGSGLSDEQARRAALADLLAGMAHEVANALGAVEGWARLAREKKGESEREEALRRLESSAQITTKLARSMLRIARGDKSAPSELLNLCEIAGSVVKMMAPLAQAKAIRIESYMPPEAWVKGGYADLVSVFWNVLQNAVELGPQGSSIELHMSEADGFIHVEILDEGPGIPESMLPRLFEPYASAKAGGTGLGLSLVKKSVLAHGGVITAENRTRGARFSIKLPSTKPPTPSKRPRRSASVRHGLAGMSVLVVEDDEPLREMVTTGLSLLGARVQGVASAAEARAIDEPVEVAVVDLTLEDLRGDLLVQELRDAGKIKRVIMVSGLSTLPPGVAPDLSERWIRKPYKLEELAEALSHS